MRAQWEATDQCCTTRGRWRGGWRPSRRSSGPGPASPSLLCRRNHLQEHTETQHTTLDTQQPVSTQLTQTEVQQSARLGVKMPPTNPDQDLWSGLKTGARRPSPSLRPDRDPELVLRRQRRPTSSATTLGTAATTVSHLLQAAVIQTPEVGSAERSPAVRPTTVGSEWTALIGRASKGLWLPACRSQWTGRTIPSVCSSPPRRCKPDTHHKNRITVRLSLLSVLTH